jgi:hypothetical protein
MPSDDNDLETYGRVLLAMDKDIFADDSLTGRVIGRLWPDLTDLVGQGKTSLAKRRVLQVAVRLLQIRLAEGQQPNALPDFGEITVDPVTLKLLRYMKTKRGFILYSVGGDGIDDGGLTVSRLSRLHNPHLIPIRTHLRVNLDRH